METEPNDTDKTPAGPSSGSREAFYAPRMETEPNDTDKTPAGPSSESREAFWRANKRLILVLLSVWLVVSLGCGVWWVEWLNQFTIGSLPLGFWIAQQGSIYTFVILILIYAICADRLEREHGVEE